VAYACATLARQIFSELRERRTLLIGAGETIALAARHLYQQGVRELVIANRDVTRGEELAREYGARAIGLGELAQELPYTDIVIASTASSLPILGKGAVERALRERKHRPMFIVDLAVPRDVEPEVAELADVYLYTIDDLREVIDDNRRAREVAADQAEAIIGEQTSEFVNWQRGLDAVAAIRDYREAAEARRNASLVEARRQLARGEAADAVLQQLAERLTRRLIHQPTVGLREAARSGNPERMDQARRVLGVDSPEEDDDS